MFKAGTTCLELFEALLIEEQLHRWQTSSTTGGSPAVSRNTTDTYDSSIVPLQLEIMVTLDTGTRAHQLEPWKSQCKNIYLILYIYIYDHACMHACIYMPCIAASPMSLHTCTHTAHVQPKHWAIKSLIFNLPICAADDLRAHCKYNGKWSQILRFPWIHLANIQTPNHFFWTHNCQGHEEPKRSFRRTGWLGLRWNEYSHENGPQLMRQVLPKSRAIDSLAGHD